MIFGPIDWDFRFQRPQHLAQQAARHGFRVMYVEPTIWHSSDYSANSTLVSDGVEVLKLAWPQQTSYSPVSGISDVSGQALAAELQGFFNSSGSGNVVLLVAHPMWMPIVKHLSHYRAVYDSMDLHGGFEVKSEDVDSVERQVLQFADAVTASSASLVEHISKHGRADVVTIRNGVDFDHFFSDFSSNDPLITPKIGYFGAVAEWFDVEAIQSILSHCPDYEISIVGEVTDRDVYQQLSTMPRVELLGELPYAQLPEFCRTIQVGLIPFKVTELIRATNPVKMYEYAAAGLPVVASGFLEAVSAAQKVSGIFVASAPSDFGSLTRQALAITEQVREELISWARANTWSHRVAQLVPVLNDFPRVSIIILMWNRAGLTINCLDSVLRRSGYPNLEVILVDNASDECESDIVRSWIENGRTDQVRYIRNNRNLGFAGGNNVGIEASSGEFVILLNNDTEVLFGWVQRALRHFRLNRNLGILGVSTDNIGNEGRVTSEVPAGQPWQVDNQERFGLREPILIPARTVAFFCVVLPRTTLEDVGLLDEDYGVGMFEDDDYCRRVEQKGLEIGIARDIFVHHEHQASFSKLHASDYSELFQRNKAAYESRWGRWIPHSYGTDHDAFR